jgi:PAS domain S-box-containing protein
LDFSTLPHRTEADVSEYYNKAFVDYVGSYPGTDTWSRTALHHPDDQPVLEAARKAGVAAGIDYIVETRLRRHDGAYRWHRVHNKPLLRNGRAIGWLGTAVDIHDVREANAALEERIRERTAALEAANQRLSGEVQQRKATERVLRESETRYRMLYNRTPMALQSVDPSGRLLDVNDTWLSMFGYTRDEVLGRSPAEFMTPASAEMYRSQTRPEMLASDGTVRTVDYQFVTSKGEIFDGRLSARAEFGAGGCFVRNWSAIADVTAEKRADRELRQMQRLEAVGQLTAGIAHDFNNLLTAILANLDLLEQRLPHQNARLQPLLNGARAAAQRGATLIAQLLAFSRQQHISPETVDLNALVRNMTPLLRSTIGGAIRIETESGPRLWPTQADPTQLELAIMNLAINARDAMPEGGTITIRTDNVTRSQPERAEDPPPGEHVLVAVTDNGNGMPADIRDRIFEPFFTTKGAGKGSGLGLPQVLGMAKQLGGGVSVESSPGRGTCVTIFLPRAPAPADSPNGARSADDAPAGTEGRLGHILQRKVAWMSPQ